MFHVEFKKKDWQKSGCILARILYLTACKVWYWWSTEHVTYRRFLARIFKRFLCLWDLAIQGTVSMLYSSYNHFNTSDLLLHLVTSHDRLVFVCNDTVNSFSSSRIVLYLAGCWGKYLFRNLCIYTHIGLHTDSYTSSHKKLVVVKT